ncbi:MAG: hypothetical protein ACLQJR_05795 [Stellaceae bacterium]
MIFIESEGALYRGASRCWPKERWSKRQRRFLPYTGAVPKPIEWGSEISRAEALNMMMDAMLSRAADALARRRRPRRR